MIVFGGLDWGGTPDAKGTAYYIPVLITVSGDLEDLQDRFERARPGFQMKTGQEFHGHDVSEKMLTAVLNIAASMNLRVSAVIYDKVATLQSPEAKGLPAAKDFPAQAALSVLEPFLAQQQVAKIWYDEDIKGKARQKTFHTAVQRLHRQHHPNTNLEIRPKPSEGSELIQIADIVAYSLSIMARGMIKTPELRRRMAAIRDEPRHRILGPKRRDA